MTPSHLSEARRGQIEESFTGVTSSHDYLERTSHVLALISSGLGVALASSTAGQVLEHIHFSRLSTGRVLAVLVTQAGAVQDRVLTLDRELTHLELETAARYLNENFRGWPIERIRAEVARRVEVEREAYQQMLASVEELCRKGALAGGEAGPAIFVDGMANLIAAEVDRERLRQMLLALEAKQRLVELLTAYVDGRQQEVRVVVGLDEASPAMQDLVLIGAPARLGGANLGTVAVIAPTRIQYQEMIQAVRYIARLSERILEASRRAGIPATGANLNLRLTAHGEKRRARRTNYHGSKAHRFQGECAESMPEQETELTIAGSAGDCAPDAATDEPVADAAVERGEVSPSPGGAREPRGIRAVEGRARPVARPAGPVAGRV